MNTVKHRKIALMGFTSVGKSSLAIQFVQGQFVDFYDPTIENTFTKPVKIRNQDYDLNIVDTAGQDEYSIFPTQYSVDVHGYVLVYAIDSEKSFEVVKALYDKLVDVLGNPQVPVILVGNKSDLQNQRVVSREEGERLARDIRAVFVESCAKDKISVNELFQKALLQIEKRQGNIPDDSGARCTVS